MSDPREGWDTMTTERQWRPEMVLSSSSGPKKTRGSNGQSSTSGGTGPITPWPPARTDATWQNSNTRYFSTAGQSVPVIARNTAFYQNQR